MIESLILGLRGFSAELMSKDLEGLPILFLVHFPTFFLSLIFYEIPMLKGLSRKQLLLNNIILLFMTILYICFFFGVFVDYWEIAIVFFGFIPPVIFLYLKIFRKQNYMFYNLVNYYWVSFWSAYIFKDLFSIYIITLVYLIIFFYKRLYILVLSIFLVTGLYLLRFYGIYIFDSIIFYFLILFLSILFFFSFIKFVIFLLKGRKQTSDNQNKFDFKKNDYYLLMVLSLIVVVLFVLYEK